MSTILKALRRLEEDRPLDATISLDPSVDRSLTSGSLPATNPQATDELRNRILAEELAAEAGGTNLADSSTSKTRVRIITAIAGAVLVTALIVGLVLGFSSPPPAEDAAPESVALASPSPRSRPTASSPQPRQSSPTPSPPSPLNPLAAWAEDAPSASGNSDDQPFAGPAIGIAAIPTAQSGNTIASRVSSEDPALPGSGRATSSSTPAQPPPRLTPKPALRVSSEKVALAAPIQTGTALESDAPTADLASAGSERSLPPTSVPAKRSKSKSAPISSPDPNLAESQTTRAPDPAVSAAKISTDPSVEKPLKVRAETPPTSNTESTPGSTAATVEEHNGRIIPDITVLRTAWHPNPERRSAKIRLLDTKEVLNLKEGDAVGGLVIQEISPSAVIFRSGEIELRLRVGQPGSGS